MRRTEKALTGEPDYRAHIKNADVEYFNPPDYLASSLSPGATSLVLRLKQIRVVLDAMPASTETERRNRALIVFTIPHRHPRPLVSTLTPRRKMRERGIFSSTVLRAKLEPIGFCFMVLKVLGLSSSSSSPSMRLTTQLGILTADLPATWVTWRRLWIGRIPGFRA